MLDDRVWQAGVLILRDLAGFVELILADHALAEQDLRKVTFASHEDTLSMSDRASSPRQLGRRRVQSPGGAAAAPRCMDHTAFFHCESFAAYVNSRATFRISFWHQPAGSQWPSLSR